LPKVEVLRRGTLLKPHHVVHVGVVNLQQINIIYNAQKKIQLYILTDISRNKEYCRNYRIRHLFSMLFYNP
jgi:hypothetical protein